MNNIITVNRLKKRPKYVQRDEEEEQEEQQPVQKIPQKKTSKKVGINN